MNERVDSWGEQYAVIEAGHEGRPERFVLSYREEKSLRDLIAAPSIIKLGFASREQAEANIEGWLQAVATRAQVPTPTIKKGPKSINPDDIPLDRAQRGFAPPIRIFDSRNEASSALRASVAA